MLSQESRNKLNAVIGRMKANNEPESAILEAVGQFKAKYDTPSPSGDSGDINTTSLSPEELASMAQKEVATPAPVPVSNAVIKEGERPIIAGENPFPTPPVDLSKAPVYGEISPLQSVAVSLSKAPGVKQIVDFVGTKTGTSKEQIEGVRGIAEEVNPKASMVGEMVGATPAMIGAAELGTLAMPAAMVAKLPIVSRILSSMTAGGLYGGATTKGTLKEKAVAAGGESLLWGAMETGILGLGKTLKAYKLAGSDVGKLIDKTRKGTLTEEEAVKLEALAEKAENKGLFKTVENTDVPNTPKLDMLSKENPVLKNTKVEDIDGLTEIPAQTISHKRIKGYVDPATKEKITGFKDDPNMDLFYFDIDDFKSINDTYGHDTGDTVLKALGKFIGEKFGTASSFGRIGGEEFYVAMPKGTNNKALLKEFLEQVPDRVKVNGEYPITISGGFGNGTILDKAGKERIKADKLAYDSKQAGKNRITIDNEGKIEYLFGKEGLERPYVDETNLRVLEEQSRRLLDKPDLSAPERESLERALQTITERRNKLFAKSSGTDKPVPKGQEPQGTEGLPNVEQSTPLTEAEIEAISRLVPEDQRQAWIFQAREEASRLAETPSKPAVAPSKPSIHDELASEEIALEKGAKEPPPEVQGSAPAIEKPEYKAHDVTIEAKNRLKRYTEEKALLDELVYAYKDADPSSALEMGSTLTDGKTKQGALLSVIRFFKLTPEEIAKMDKTTFKVPGRKGVDDIGKMKGMSGEELSSRAMEHYKGGEFSKRKTLKDFEAEVKKEFDNEQVVQDTQTEQEYNAGLKKTEKKAETPFDDDLEALSKKQAEEDGTVTQISEDRVGKEPDKPSTSLNVEGMIAKKKAMIESKHVKELVDEQGNKQIVSIENGHVTGFTNKTPSEMGKMNTQVIEDLLDKDLAKLDRAIKEVETQRDNLQRIAATSKARGKALLPKILKLNEKIDGLNLEKELTIQRYAPGELNNKVFTDKNGKRWTIQDAKQNDVDVHYDKIASENARNANKPFEGVNEPLDIPPETRKEWFLRKVADSFQRLGSIQRAISKQFGLKNIPEKLDTYLAQELSNSKVAVKIKDYKEKFLAPLEKEIQKSGLSMEDVAWYRYAEHAPETNKAMAGKFPDKYSDRVPGSGMDDTMASEVIDHFNKLGKGQQLQKISKILDDINTFHTDLLENSGLKSAEEMKAWKSDYKHYVSLKGFYEKELEGLGIESIVKAQNDMRSSGKGFSTWYKTKKRGGRTTFADVEMMLPNTFAKVMNDIIVAGKNEVGQTFHSFVKKYPDDTMWKIIDNPSGAMLTDKEVFKVMINGKPVIIEVKDEGLKRALLSITDATGAEKIFGAIGTANRTLGALITRWNPEFMFGNLPKDIQEAMANITADNSAKMAAQVFKDVPSGIKGMYGYLKGDLSSPMAKWADRYSRSGGRVDFNDYMTPEKMKKDLMHMIETFGPNYKHNLKRYLYGMRDFVENTNSAVENGARVAYFKRLVESGMTEARAAQRAKNLTVNFNRKGEWGSVFNSMWLFSNATIQGGRRSLIFMKSKKGKAIAAGLFGAGYGSAEMNRNLNEKKYYEFSDYARLHNWMYITPDGNAATFPLPYNIGAFYAMGVLANDMVHGKKKPLEAAGKMAGAVWDTYTPWGSGTLMQAFTPSPVRPAMDLSLNKDFAGNKIKPERKMNEKLKPESELYFKDVSWESKKATEFLNKLSGGNKYNKGLADVSPETIDYLVKYYLGGIGDLTLKTSSDIVKVGENIKEKRTSGMGVGESLNETRKDLVSGKILRANEIPVARKFFKQPPEDTGRKEFFSSSDKLDALKAEYDDLKISDPKKAAEFRKEHKELALILKSNTKPTMPKAPKMPSLADLTKTKTIGMYKAEIGKIKGLKDIAEKKGDEAKVEKYKKEIETLMKEYNAKYEKTTKE